LVVFLLVLVAGVFADDARNHRRKIDRNRAEHDPGTHRHKGDGNQRKFTGTELALTNDLATRREAVGFRLVTPAGRGASEDDNTRGPCGQYVTTFPYIDRLEWKTDNHVHVDVLILDANGGGVITQFYGAGPNPAGPLFNDWKNEHLRLIVPDVDNIIYRIKVQVPSSENFEGPGTVQILYNSIGRETENFDSPPKTYFQCIDVVLTASASAVSTSVTLILAALSVALLVL